MKWITLFVAVLAMLSVPVLYATGLSWTHRFGQAGPYAIGSTPEKVLEVTVTNEDARISAAATGPTYVTDGQLIQYPEKKVVSNSDFVRLNGTADFWVIGQDVDTFLGLPFPGTHTFEIEFKEGRVHRIRERRFFGY
ncbi:hypothetical protein [Jannaschia ovalis]|uniref:Copper-binding protein n=1 Tax=Jannaschia ovalis TaxID=3038773 RepID=A0ABY8L9F9_9RHOB|nr:hypothetical protein [Jannaschia sp. GRR-S6-38]WGH77993.1 hypothetical protein P8627_13275 [Jannaschia sp. GRR-S6-38]